MPGIEEYTPTPAEEKLLEVLLNPQNRYLSVTDKCERAECSRQTYYDAFKKPGFVEYYQNSCIDLVKTQIGPIINSFVRETLGGSFQHGKVLIEMAGLYKEVSRREITGKDGESLNNPSPSKTVVDWVAFAKEYPEDFEIVAKCQEILEKMPEKYIKTNQ